MGSLSEPQKPYSSDSVEHPLSSYSVIQVNSDRFLIHQSNGQVLAINDTAELFIDLLTAGHDRQQVCTEVANAFSIDIKQIEGDFDQFISNLERLASAACEDNLRQDVDDDEIAVEHFQAIDGDLSDSKKLQTSLLSPSSLPTLHLSIATLNFSIRFPDLPSFELCSALLSTMSSATDRAPDAKREITFIRVLRGRNGWAIEVDGSIRCAFSSHRRISEFLRTCLFDRIGQTLENWICLHAAAVANQSGDAILLVGTSGSGKSTLALKLAQMGLTYLGDDSLILDLDRQEILPFPAAANLKPGAWEIYRPEIAELDQLPIFHADVRPVKYLPPPESGIAASAVATQRFSAKYLMFPTFSLDHSGTASEVEVGDLFTRLIDSGIYTRLNSSAPMSQRFIEFFLGLHCREICYSSTTQALQLLARIIPPDPPTQTVSPPEA